MGNDFGKGANRLAISAMANVTHFEKKKSDAEILDRLFTMVDRTGDDQIFFRDFIVGVAPLITGDLMEKLQFSFELYDMDSTGQIKKDEMTTILGAMNSTASYFGDPVMTKDEIEQLVEDVFREADANQSGTLSYAEYLTAVANHQILTQFINGQGSVRYGSGAV
eukprot:CAMPEP_0117850326 /NCGR_PEP_ID=MMETSP0949-20121206/21614_1 /TAXON_ID=44440 /ORGANISM="Chattonella subsalsa, Strain CCMP2191" /LENGTH=164 /DNA_ID=CAMNT_0005697685 /DNA_START=47 /DNA_END=542 /DNA_ORIENTATION=+